MARRRFLTDKMWAKIGPLLPEMPTGAEGGRPWEPPSGAREREAAGRPRGRLALFPTDRPGSQP